MASEQPQLSQSQGGFLTRLWKRTSNDTTPTRPGLRSSDSGRLVASASQEFSPTASPILDTSPRDMKLTLCPKGEEMIKLLLELARKRDLWVPDHEVHECFHCTEKFSAVRRRHHCRICGQVFCKKCTRGKVELPNASLRCCKTCTTYLEVTPEAETINFIKSRLLMEITNKKNTSGSLSSESDEGEEDRHSHQCGSPNDPQSEISCKDLADQIERAAQRIHLSHSNGTKHKKLNAQLFVNVTEAKNLNINQECTGLYCLLSLGKQQVRTVSAKLNPLTRSAQWKEGYFFDITSTNQDGTFDVSVWAEYLSAREETGFIGELRIPLSALIHQKPIDHELKLRSKGTDNSIRVGTIRIKINFAASEAKVTPDDFQLLRVLGRGNFGKVMQVKKKDTNRIYAMKVLRKEAVVQNDAIEHTMSERNVLKKISHPFIVSLKYSFQTKEKLYLVLDYLCGGELFTHLSSVEHFSEERTRFYTAQIVMALGHLHENHIIYRDLKPENLMLDMDGYLCLTDFGLCKEGVGPGQKTRTFCGSPEYLAPEILKGRPYDKTVDWWALGTFVYEMLSGWPPFFDENQKIMNRRILNDPLTFEESLFSQHAQSLIRGLLDRDPEKRLGSGPLGTRNIMNHPFFAGFDWDKLYNRQIEPPFKPHLRHIMDTKFFSEEFTGEPVKDTFVDSNISTTHQAAFAGFSWHPPNEFLEKANNSNDAGIPDYAKKRRSRRVTGLKLNGPASSMQLIGRESPASGGDAASPLNHTVSHKSGGGGGGGDGYTPSPGGPSILPDVGDLASSWDSDPVFDLDGHDSRYSDALIEGGNGMGMGIGSIDDDTMSSMSSSSMTLSATPLTLSLSTPTSDSASYSAMMIGSGNGSVNSSHGY